MKKFITTCLLLSLAIHASAQKITAFTDKATGKIGFKKNGEIIIPATVYEEWNGYAEGLISVGKNNKWGYIDLKGNVVVELVYSYAGDFHEGMALVSLKRGKFGYIDKTGAKKTEFIFQHGMPFYQGLAAVQMKDKYGFKYLRRCRY